MNFIIVPSLDFDICMYNFTENKNMFLLPFRITQPEMPQTPCILWILPACCKLSTSCSKSLDFIKLQQVCENQTCCNLIFADLLQVVETTCIKLASEKSQLSTCIKPVDSLQQTCYHQAGASDVNAS